MNGPRGVVSSNGFPDVSTYDVLDFPGTNVIWAATEIGIVESRDNGATWALAENGLPAVSIWQMRLRDDEVVVATHGRGIWTLPTGAVVTGIEGDESLPQTVSISSAWPNPFTERTTLAVSLPAAGHMRAEVFDLQGRRVAVLADEERSAGRHELTWRGDGVPAGAYWVRITTPSGRTTRAVVRLQ